jgi:hypothetical protein
MSIASGSNGETSQPSCREAASSPTALSNLIASGLLLAGFFLPHSMACDNRTQHPISIAREVVSSSTVPSDFLALSIFWPFAFAGLTFWTVMLLVMIRPTWFDLVLIGIPVSTAFVLSILWFLLLFNGTQSSRMAMTIAATTTPAAACVAARMLWLCRSGQIAAAAAWGQGLLCVLAAFSLKWFWFPPVKSLLWGGFLSIGSALLMMLASWCWITRARYDLCDRSSRHLPFQVSLRQLLLGISVTAIALTYWRLMGL